MSDFLTPLIGGLIIGIAFGGLIESSCERSRKITKYCESVDSRVEYNKCKEEVTK